MFVPVINFIIRFTKFNSHEPLQLSHYTSCTCLILFLNCNMRLFSAADVSLGAQFVMINFNM